MAAEKKAVSLESLKGRGNEEAGTLILQCRNNARRKGSTKGRSASKDIKTNQHQLKCE